MFTTFKDASRYTRNYAKGYYRLLVRELHLKKQLLNHGFLLVKLKSSWLGQPVRNICVENDHDYVLLVVSTFWSIPHSWFITWFVIRVTRRVPLVEQELTTLPEHLRAPPDFRGVRIARALVCCVVFCRSLFVPVSFPFGHCVICSYSLTDSNYPFDIFNSSKCH